MMKMMFAADISVSKDTQRSLLPRRRKTLVMPRNQIKAYLEEVTRQSGWLDSWAVLGSPCVQLTTRLTFQLFNQKPTEVPDKDGTGRAGMSPKGRFALINKSKFPKRASDERSQIIPGVVRILRHPHTHTHTTYICSGMWKGAGNFWRVHKTDS